MSDFQYEGDTELLEKLQRNFAGKIVRKDLTKRIKEGANVPVYVLEYLLGMYCSSLDEDEIEAISLIEQGASLTNSTKLILADVVNNAQQSTNLIGNIAASATQQSQSLRLATQEMEQISEIVQTTAATAEESSMSAQQLYNHSDELKNAIHSFQLRNNYNNIQVL